MIPQQTTPERRDSRTVDVRVGGNYDADTSGRSDIYSHHSEEALRGFLERLETRYSRQVDKDRRFGRAVLAAITGLMDRFLKREPQVAAADKLHIMQAIKGGALGLVFRANIVYPSWTVGTDMVDYVGVALVGPDGQQRGPGILREPHTPSGVQETVFDSGGDVITEAKLSLEDRAALSVIRDLAYLAAPGGEVLSRGR